MEFPKQKDCHCEQERNCVRKTCGNDKNCCAYPKEKIHLCGESDEEGKAANDDSSHGDRCTSGKYAAGTGYDQSGSRNRAA